METRGYKKSLSKNMPSKMQEASTSPLNLTPDGSQAKLKDFKNQGSNDYNEQSDEYKMTMYASPSNNSRQIIKIAKISTDYVLDKNYQKHHERKDWGGSDLKMENLIRLLPEVKISKRSKEKSQSFINL